MIPKMNQRNIEQVADRCGGQPTVGGTRIRVATILGCYRQGMSVEEIIQQYPLLRPADVHDALAFAYDHMERIDGDLELDSESSVKAKRGGGSSEG
jgi:uncharacterized protein (DUF433 family)